MLIFEKRFIPFVWSEFKLSWECKLTDNPLVSAKLVLYNDSPLNVIISQKTNQPTNKQTR